MQRWVPQWFVDLCQTELSEKQKKYWMNRLHDDQETRMLVLTHARLLGNAHDLSFLSTFEGGKIEP